MGFNYSMYCCNHTCIINIITKPLLISWLGLQNIIITASWDCMVMLILFKMWVFFHSSVDQTIAFWQSQLNDSMHIYCNYTIPCIFAQGGGHTKHHMFIFAEPPSDKCGTKITPLPPVFQISSPLFPPFYIWPPSPFPLRNSTHHFLFSPESLIHFFQCVCVCVLGGGNCDVCSYGEISETSSSHVNYFSVFLPDQSAAN